MTILIVDDNEPNLYQLQVLLGGSGYQVVTAVNGAEALAKARQNPPDLVISDILMPVMDGFTLCREWMKDERLRQIPFVFYTATYTDERDREFALGLGAERFLVKPEEPEVFIRTIREVIQQLQRPPAPPSPRPVQVPQKEEAGYLKEYNEALIRKLEAKMQQLEQANRELERDIAERKRAEEQLLESEDRYRDLVEHSSDLICTHDLNGRLLSVNQVLARSMGYNPDEMLGIPVREFLVPEVRDQFDAYLETIGREGSARGLMVLQTRGGERRIWEYSNTLRTKGVPAPIVRSMAHDVTQRVQAERALRESEELYRSVVNSVAEGILLQDAAGRIVASNHSAERILGRTAEGLKGTIGPDPSMPAIHEDGSPLPAENLPHINTLRTGKSQSNVRIGFHKPDGTLVWVLANTAPIFHERENAPYAVVTSFVDITEHKRAEDALMEERHLFRTLMDNLPDAIYFKDRESRFTRHNKANAKKFGLNDPAQAIGKTDFDFFTEAHAQPAFADEQEIIRTGQPLVGKEEKETWPDGHVTWASTTEMPLRDANGNIIGTFGVSRDITEHKRAEEMLQEYERVVEGSDERISVVDHQYRYLLANRAFLGHVGLERGDVVGSSVPEVLGEEFFARVVKPKLDECLQGKVVRFEAKSHHPKPRQRDILASYFPIEGEHGVDRVACVLQDITERKRAEKALRDSEERFRQVAESAGEWIWEVDAEGLYRYASPAVEQILGYKPEEVVGKVHFYDLLAPEMRDQHQAAASEVFSHKKPLHPLVKSVVRKDGTMAIMETTGVPVLDETGNLMGYRGVNKDITERKLAEAQLAGERDLLHALMDNIPDKIFFKDAEGRFVRINRAHAESLGLKDPAQAVGKTDFDVHSPEDAREAYQDEKKILETGEPLIGKIEKISESDGKARWNLVTKVPLKNNQGQVVGLVGTSRDITARMQAQEALQVSEHQLAQAMDLAMLAHWEFNPATGIFTFNDRFYALYGTTAEREGGYHMSAEAYAREFLYPEDAHLVADEVAKALATRDPDAAWALEHRIRRRDGETRHIVVRISVIKNSEGVTIRTRGVNQDVTERKLAEAENARLAAIVNSSDDAIFSTTREGFIETWNAGAERMYGYTAEEIKGEHFSTFIPQDRRADLDGVEERLLRGEALVHFEHEDMRKDGSRLQALLTLSPIKDDTGFVTGVSIISRDITDRKWAEAQVAERTRLATLIGEVGTALGRAETLREGLEQCAQALVRNLGLAFARVWTLNESEKMLELQSSAGMYTHTDGPHGRVPLGEFKIGHIAASGEPHLTNKVAEDSFSGDKDWARREGMVAFAGYPLMVEGRVAGVVAGFAREHLSQAVMQAFASVADATAQFINRKRAEEALRESEEKYRSLVSNIPDVVWTMNAENRFTFISKNIEKLSGFSIDEVYQQGMNPYLASLHPDDLPKVAEGLRALFAEGRPFDVEVRVKRKDGEWKWIHDRALATYEKNGIRYADGLLSDITDRKRAEEAMRETEEKYRVLYESSRDAIMLLTPPEWKFTAANPAAIALFGARDEREFVSVDPWGLSPEYQPDGALSSVKARQMIDLATERSSHLFEWTHKRFSGEEFLATVMLTRMFYRGQPFLQATVRDITERKRAEAEHIRLVTAIEQAAETVVITDIRGNIEYVNPAFTRITGYSRDEVLGQNPRILKSGKQDAALYQQLWETILKGGIWQGELINRRKDGSLFTEHMSITPVRGERGEISHFIATKLDVTARKQLELQLLQAQKMEAVGRLAGGVAHDFNNLLTIINGFAALLSRQTSAEDPRHEQLKEILTAGETAASLTRQLLAFSRRQLLEPRVLGLNSVVADIENMLRHLIGEDVELVTTLQPDLGRVKVDPGQIEQVIMNLVVNARDAMPQGGKLLIETSDVEIDEDYVRSHAPMLPGKYVMMAVSDTGCGMDLETQAHIFEPFFTTKEEGRGTGLGLATVYGIVKQSGGFIWVYSEPGRGSTFKIYFPRVEEVLPTAKTVKVRAQRVEGSKTVLVVEDEAGVRSLVCQALAAHGYKVLEAAGAARALKISKQHTQPIDLLLTDVVMPRTSGKELAKRLSSLHPETKVLYMSGYTDDAVVRLGLSEGGTPFLQKPFGPDALLLKVHEVLEMKP